MKKLLSLILASVMLVSALVSCAPRSTSDTATQSASESVTEESYAVEETVSESTESVSSAVAESATLDETVPESTKSVSSAVVESTTLDETVPESTESVSSAVVESTTLDETVPESTEKANAEYFPKVSVVSPDADTSILHNFYVNTSKAIFENADGENVLYSPVNVFAALAILSEAAVGESKSEILRLLGLESSDEASALALTLADKLTRDGDRSQTLLGASLWMDDSYHYDENCASMISDKYFAELFEGDFADARYIDKIKSWMSKKTKGLLDDQIADLEIDPATVCTIVTSLYFKDKWENGFNEKKTGKMTFHAPAGDVVCDFMTKTDFCGRYYVGEDFKAVIIPFEEAGDMILLIPDKNIDPSLLLNSKAAASLMLFGKIDTSAEAFTAQVTVSLPKFDISYNGELNDILKSLGVKSVFTPGVADLSALLDPVKAPYVSSVQHAVRFRIDENGGEGATYTDITMAPTSMVPPKEKIEFVFDRPFAFSVLSPDGEPLFTGIVNDPTA